jgi:hypothetical protein
MKGNEMSLNLQPPSVEIKFAANNNVLPQWLYLLSGANLADQVQSNGQANGNDHQPQQARVRSAEIIGCTGYPLYRS